MEDDVLMLELEREVDDIKKGMEDQRRILEEMRDMLEAFVAQEQQSSRKFGGASRIQETKEFRKVFDELTSPVKSESVGVIESNITQEGLLGKKVKIVSKAEEQGYKYKIYNEKMNSKVMKLVTACGDAKNLDGINFVTLQGGETVESGDTSDNLVSSEKGSGTNRETASVQKIASPKKAVEVKDDIKVEFNGVDDQDGCRVDSFLQNCKRGKTLGIGSFGEVGIVEHALTWHKVVVKILDRKKIKDMDMVTWCFGEDRFKRPSAQDLLTQPFFKNCYLPKFLVQDLLMDLPHDVKQRFKKAESERVQRIKHDREACSSMGEHVDEKRIKGWKFNKKKLELDPVFEGAFIGVGEDFDEDVGSNGTVPSGKKFDEVEEVAVDLRLLSRGVQNDINSDLIA